MQTRAGEFTSMSPLERRRLAGGGAQSWQIVRMTGCASTLSRVPREPLIGQCVAVGVPEHQQWWLLWPLPMTTERVWSHLTSDKALGLQECR